MTEAPKEIWIEIDDNLGDSHGRYWVEPPPNEMSSPEVKYTRADLMDWQPIETALKDFKDGSFFLVWGDGYEHPEIVRWDSSEEEWIYSDGTYGGPIDGWDYCKFLDTPNA